jgi:exopolyphosphatase/guanosine-5'-triphosphate,3'-diphosphate pyrophosphatase
VSGTASDNHAWTSRRRAVIDIGSNSVRLVIYEGPPRAPFPIVNEKALCGLGRDMASGGALDAGAVEAALATLRRFRRLIEEHGDPQTDVFATAAVREARDGKSFVRRIDDLGFRTRIIPGGEEAALAAAGVVSYEPGATGLVGDMGGGSLELVALEGGEPRESVSLSIGPLRLMHETGERIGPASETAHRALARVGWLQPGRFQALYSVGGAWRALARIHMQLKSYPLTVLHHYEMSRAEAVSVCELVMRQSRRSLEVIPGITKRRLDTLPFAAAALKALLERSEAQKVIVSAGGAREGVLYLDLPSETRALDPLIEGAHFFAERLAPDAAMGPALQLMTRRLFADETPAQARLRAATCILADVAAYFHPDMRGLQAFDTALRAPFYGVTHRERIEIGYALFVRHEGKGAGEPDAAIVAMLAPEERDRSLRLGLAMRFATSLAPKAPHVLEGCELVRDKGRLCFRAPKAVQSLMGEIPQKRLENLAAEFGLTPVEAYF